MGNLTGRIPTKGIQNTVPVAVDVKSMPAVTLNAEDIEIGAVEIKNSTDDTRATVGANGLYVDVRTSAIPTGASTSAKQDTQTTLLQGIAGMIPSAYDYTSLSYTGSNLTGVVFKSGGSGGTTVSTLTLAYDGDNNLTSVTKT